MTRAHELYKKAEELGKEIIQLGNVFIARYNEVVGPSPLFGVKKANKVLDPVCKEIMKKRRELGRILTHKDFTEDVRTLPLR